MSTKDDVSSKEQKGSRRHCSHTNRSLAMFQQLTSRNFISFKASSITPTATSACTEPVIYHSDNTDEAIICGNYDHPLTDQYLDLPFHATLQFL